MGSNLGPTLASFAMHMIEQKITKESLFYCRYVDDIFALFRTKRDSELFLEHINSLHSNIKFTCENEKDGRLPFLDVIVKRINNRFSTSWYMKPTNTGVYLPKCAYAPKMYKQAAIRSLYYRAFKLSSSEHLFSESCDKIRNIFVSIGYHYKLLDKIKSQVTASHPCSRSTQQDSNIVYWKLPYIDNLCATTNKLIKKMNTIVSPECSIRVAYSTRKTSFAFPNKDKVPTQLRSNIVYKYVCDQCDGHTYIGESVRHMATRASEHIRGDPQPSEVTMHGHRKKLENFQVVISTQYTKIGEAIIYETVPAALRLNHNKPKFQLQLFNFADIPTMSATSVI